MKTFRLQLQLHTIRKYNTFTQHFIKNDYLLETIQSAVK